MDLVIGKHSFASEEQCGSDCFSRCLVSAFADRCLVKCKPLVFIIENKEPVKSSLVVNPVSCSMAGFLA